MATKPRQKTNVLLYLIGTAVVGLTTFLFYRFFSSSTGAHAFEGLMRIPWLVLLTLLAYLGIRVINALLFDFVFRIRRGYEAPTLVRNIFTLVTLAIFFAIVFNRVYHELNLGALLTTSAIFGVIIGLALQDTLGNFFSGISLHADRPFQVGDVIAVGELKITGVVEGITWRAVKIRTFQNHVML